MGNTSVVNIEVRVDDRGSTTIRQIGESARTSAGQAERSFRGVGSTLEDMNRKAAAAWGSFKSGAGSALDMVFSLKTALIGLGLGLVARDALKTTAGFESMTMSLKTLTGSMEAAKAAAAWIEQFTARTPYQLQEVTEAYKKLLAYGFDPKKFLGPLGDAASALTETLDDAVELIADASTGQFDRLRKFGMRAQAEGGKVALSWRENGQQMQTTVANTSEAITGKLLEIFSQYEGAMADQMDAWSGLWSNMLDVVSKFERQVMESGPFQAMKAGLKDFLAYLDTEQGKMDLAQWALDMANAVMGAFQVMAGAAKLFIGYLETVRLAVNGVKEAWIQLGILAAKVDPLLDPKKYLFDGSQWKKRKEDIQGLNEELVATQIEGVKIFENWQNLDGAFDALKKSLEGMQAAANAAATAAADNGKANASALGEINQALHAAYQPAPGTAAAMASAKEVADALAAVRDRTAELSLSDKELAERKIDQEFAKFAAVLGKANPELAKLIELEREHLAQTEADAAMMKELNSAFDVSIKLNVQLQKALKDRAETMKAMAGIAADAEERDAQRIADAHKDAAEESKKSWERMYENVQDATADTFYSLFSDVGEGWGRLLTDMKSGFLRLLSQMAAQAIMQPIIVPVVQSIMGLGAGGGSVFGSLFGGASGAAGVATPGATGSPFSSGVGIPGVQYMSGLPGMGFMSAPLWGSAWAAEPAFAPLAQTFGITAGPSLAGILGAAGLGSMGYSLLGPLLGLPQNAVTPFSSAAGAGLGFVGGTALGGMGALAGSALGSVVPIIGTILGALGGGFLGSLFGGGKKTPDDLDLAYYGGGTDEKGARQSGRYNYALKAKDFGKDQGHKHEGEALEKATISYLDNYFTGIEDAFDIDLGPLIEKMDFNLNDVQDQINEKHDVPEVMLKKLFKNYLDDWKTALASSDKAYATTLVSGFEDITDQNELKDWLDKAVPAMQLAESIGQSIGGWLQDTGKTLADVLSDLPADEAEKFKTTYGSMFKEKTGLEQAADQVNAEFDDWVQQLQDLGVDKAFIAGIEAMRQDAIDAAQKAIRDNFNFNLDQRELAAQGLGGEATARARAKSQADEMDAAIKQFGEGSAEVARLLAIQAAENDALATAMAKTIDAYYQQMVGNQEGAAWAALQAQHENAWQQAVGAGVSDADLNRLREAMEIENQLFAAQWEFAKRERSTNLQIRMLRAQGHDEEADAAQQALDNEKELLQARLDGWSAQDIAMLKAVQEAEEAQRAQEKAAAAAKAYSDAIGRANDKFGQFRTSIQDWLASKLTEESPGTSPESRLAAAQDQFWTTYQKAQAGDWQAAESMTGLADTYLQTLEAMYGSTAQYQTERQQIMEAMQALPSQKLYEQAVLDELKDISTSTSSTATNTGDGGAVTSALGGIPEELRGKLTEAIEEADVDYSGGMNTAEFQKFYENNKTLLGSLMGGISGKSIGELFKILDGDGDGQITPLEIENYTGQAGQDADLTAARELTTNQMLAAHAVQLTAIVHNTAAAAGAKGWEGTGWTNPFSDSVLMNYWPTRNSWIKALAGQSLYTRATGGPVWPDQPFLVGEEGPEFFIPRTSGTILDAATSRDLAGNVAGGDMSVAVLRELQATNRLLTARLGQASRETEGLKAEIKTLAGEVKALKKATRAAAERHAVK